jgi:hypothetical protein
MLLIRIKEDIKMWKKGISDNGLRRIGKKTSYYTSGYGEVGDKLDEALELVPVNPHTEEEVEDWNIVMAVMKELPEIDPNTMAALDELLKRRRPLGKPINNPG